MPNSCQEFYDGAMLLALGARAMPTKSNLMLSSFCFRHKDRNEAFAIHVNERIEEGIEVAHPSGAYNLLPLV